MLILSMYIILWDVPINYNQYYPQSVKCEIARLENEAAVKHAGGIVFYSQCRSVISA